MTSVDPGGTGSFTGDGAGLATAFVAGAAALAVAVHPDLTPSQQSDCLTATAFHIPADKALVGAGTVDPAATVTAPAPDPSAAPSPQAPASLHMEPRGPYRPHHGHRHHLRRRGGRPEHGLRRVPPPRARRRGRRPGGSAP
ncbi:hypothetical protein [Streptomyces sp. NPDC048295]|uniref:hypothetical protein n=1 Tax=Streptomyces sp. NPDC048295 TaxID=3154617 RepID=UPI00342046BB